MGGTSKKNIKTTHNSHHEFIILYVSF